MHKLLPLINTDDTDQEKIGGIEKLKSYRGSARMNADRAEVDRWQEEAQA